MASYLILNGSPQGNQGNCGVLTQFLSRQLGAQSTEVIHLAQLKNFNPVLKKIEKAKAIIWVTGTYWDSWGSPLQKLLEEMTPLEGTKALLGKPASVIVLMHSVGGKGILSRLQGVLSTMGFLIPPMSGAVLSVATEELQKLKGSDHADDFWSLQDVQVVLKNLSMASRLKVKWKSWPVDRKNFKKIWLLHD